LRVMQLECQAYAYEYGIDKPEMDGWTWPSIR
jgi:xylulose-5-phosphate/fructose-6-phosphate phosphoketolase